MEKLEGMLSYPFSIFNCSNPVKQKKFYNGLAESLKAKLENWKKYKPIRGMIEDIFKLTKDASPFKDKDTFEKAYGMPLKLLIELYSKGRVEFLLNGFPTEFAYLDYLDEILEFEPPSVSYRTS